MSFVAKHPANSIKKQCRKKIKQYNLRDLTYDNNARYFSWRTRKKWKRLMYKIVLKESRESKGNLGNANKFAKYLEQSFRMKTD